MDHILATGTLGIAMVLTAIGAVLIGGIAWGIAKIYEIGLLHGGMIAIMNLGDDE